MKIPSYTAPFLTLTSHVAPWEQTESRLEAGFHLKTRPTGRGGDREEEETEKEETERKETGRSEQHSPPQR